MTDILVGDVGGTNTRFALAARQDGRWHTRQFGRFANEDFPGFEEALGAFLAGANLKPKLACFAFAGPVQKGSVRLTNRGWTADESRLEKRFRFNRVLLCNDFTAMARSVPEYEAGKFEVIFEGSPEPDAPRLVTGPGTGLGVATLIRTRGGYHVLSGEGGHTAYAPRTELEFQLLSLLMKSQGYVSNELVCSGSGLDAVHAAFCDIFARPLEETPPQEMLARAEAGDEMFRSLIEVRANCVMGVAGDLVLANGARGGVILAGGVTERILGYLKRPDARARFVNRGPMSEYLERCPVSLLSDAEAPLIGAAAYFEQEFSS